MTYSYIIFYQRSALILKKSLVFLRGYTPIRTVITITYTFFEVAGKSPAISIIIEELFGQGPESHLCTLRLNFSGP